MIAAGTFPGPLDSPTNSGPASSPHVVAVANIFTFLFTGCLPSTMSRAEPGVLTLDIRLRTSVEVESRAVGVAAMTKDIFGSEWEYRDLFLEKACRAVG